MTFHPYHEETKTETKRVETRVPIQPCYDCDRCEAREDAWGHDAPEGWTTIRMPNMSKLHLCAPCTNVLPALLQQHKHVHETAAMSVTDMPTNGDSLPDFNAAWHEANTPDDCAETDVCGCCPCCECDCPDKEAVPEEALQRIIKVFGIEVEPDTPLAGFLHSIKLSTDKP